jgi:ubiquinone/menaquinone biosynthesis C-methylase UbiE
MVQEARRRAAGFAVPVAFSIGDAQALLFAAASFDACRARRQLISPASRAYSGAAP